MAVSVCLDIMRVRPYSRGVRAERIGNSSSFCARACVCVCHCECMPMLLGGQISLDVVHPPLARSRRKTSAEKSSDVIFFGVCLGGGGSFVFAPLPQSASPLGKRQAAHEHGRENEQTAQGRCGCGECARMLPVCEGGASDSRCHCRLVIRRSPTRLYPARAVSSSFPHWCPCLWSRPCPTPTLGHVGKKALGKESKKKRRRVGQGGTRKCNK